MDFGALLDYAKKNELPNKEVKCYRTTFGPPKKEPKSKCLSENIRKFLAKKEEEERMKLLEANKKREELLALRSQDKKANKRVRAMLKSTKAANKAVIDDARDDVNTAVTMAGPSQPDEDDYGYVSQEASAFYNKLMDKYSRIPNSEPSFSKKSASVKDLTSTKDRVRMALLKEEEEEAMGHKRKRRRRDDRKQDGEDDDGNILCSAPDRRPLYEESIGNKYSCDSRDKPEPEVKKKRPPAPPPMDYAQLLKIAAQKQCEPFKIEKKESKPVEEERPMTKKQREEYLREKEHQKRREEREKAAAKSKDKSHMKPVESQVNGNEMKGDSSFKTPSIPRIPKLNGGKGNTDQNRVNGTNGKSIAASESREPSNTPKSFGGGNTKTQFREQEKITSEAKRKSSEFSSQSFETEKKAMQAFPSLKDGRYKINLDTKKPANHTSRTVIKDELRYNNQLSRTGIKDDRPVNNNSTKPVVKDERKVPSQRSAAREDPRPSVAPGELQRPLKPESSLISKPNRSLQNSLKPPQNVMKKVESKPASSATGDMLRERLINSGNPSLPQKSQPNSSQMVKKIRPEKSSSNETSLLKGVPSKSSGAMHSGALKDKIKNGSPEKKTENSDINKNLQLDVRRPSMPEKKSSAMSERGPPDDRRPTSMAQRRPLSMADRRALMGDNRAMSSRGARGRPMHPQDARRRPPAKRRIESDDEYDSELDDFIDDGPEEGEDYSKYIKEIFGYDKSRYSYRDYEDEDECMESSFAQQMKEEFVSTKLGILEDLEDIKKEQMEKMKKKKIMIAAKKKKN